MYIYTHIALIYMSNYKIVVIDLPVLNLMMGWHGG